MSTGIFFIAKIQSGRLNLLRFSIKSIQMLQEESQMENVGSSKRQY